VSGLYQHRPGDVVNGHVLGHDQVWRPVAVPVQVVGRQPASSGGVFVAVVAALIFAPVIAFVGFVVLPLLGLSIFGAFVGVVYEFADYWPWLLAAAVVGGAAWGVRRWKR
jgi:hypothetical protein